jgi:hypothetical protein
MVRVFGNSPERVKIPDLNDVIYYHQQKEYTDQEYENSRDLKKEINKGRITLLEQFKNVKMESVVVKQVMPQAISQDDIKKAVSEVLSNFKSGQNRIDTQDVKDAISDVLGKMPIVQETKAIDAKEIKKLVAEVLAEYKPEAGTMEMSTVLLSIVPIIADAVRQEVARLQIVTSHSGSQKPSSVFMGSEFIPTVSTEGMESNIKGEERTASGGDILGSLEALQRLQKKLG